MNPPDERRGVPSASGMDRLTHCPASFDMESQVPHDTDNEDAASGTRIHAVLALQASAETLNTAELETCDMCTEQAQKVATEWAGHHGFICPEITLREQRLGMTALGRVLDVTPDSKADFIFTGQADLILVMEGKALIIDYKTGRGDTAVALDNAQLAALAVLVAGRFKVESVRVAIVQPWAGKPTVSDYNANALELAKGWLQSALHEAAHSTPDDARAGDWCKWCKAGLAGRCATFNNSQLAKVEVLEPMTIAGADDETQRKALFARAMELPAEKHAAYMRGLPLVERFVAAIKGAARIRAAEDPEFQRFYALKEKKGRRSITNVAKVFSTCHARGVTAEDFTALCSIGLGDVKEALRKATGTKGKALDTINDEVLFGAVETGKPTFELVAVGELEGGGE